MLEAAPRHLDARAVHEHRNVSLPLQLVRHRVRRHALRQVPRHAVQALHVPLRQPRQELAGAPSRRRRRQPQKLALRIVRAQRVQIRQRPVPRRRRRHQAQLRLRVRRATAAPLHRHRLGKAVRETEAPRLRQHPGHRQVLPKLRLAPHPWAPSVDSSRLSPLGRAKSSRETISQRPASPRPVRLRDLAEIAGSLPAAPPDGVHCRHSHRPNF